MAVLFGLCLPIPLMMPLAGEPHYRIGIGLLIGGGLATLWLVLGDDHVTSAPGDLVGELLLLFLVTGGVSVWLGTIRHQSVSGMLSYGYQVLLLAFFWIGRLLLRGSGEIACFWRSIVVSLTLASVVILYHLATTGAYEDIWVAHSALMSLYTDDTEVIMGIARAVFGWPNAYGALLSIAVILCLGLRSLTPSRRQKCTLVAAIVVLIAGVISTFSRLAIITLIVGVALWTATTRPRRTDLLMVGGIGAAVLGVVVLTDIVDLLLYLDTARVRLEFVPLVLRLASPLDILMGTGFQTLSVLIAGATEEIVPGLSIEEMVSTHNEYVTVLLKSGIGGFVVFVGVLAAIYQAAGRLSRADDLQSRILFGTWRTVLVLVFLSALSQEILRYSPIGTVFWMMAGAMSNFSHRAGGKTQAA